jgi:IS605 OrfB family transposase
MAGKKAEKGDVLYLGVHARLVFPDPSDEEAVLDLMRRFSSATRYAYRRLLEGKSREELKRADGPLRKLFRLNTRYADGAIAKAKAVLDSALELGNDPKKVVFGGRGLFEQLKRKHLSGKPLEALRRRWKEKRQGLLYTQGDRSKKGGNPHFKLQVEGGGLWLLVHLGEEEGKEEGERKKFARALVKTSHPQLNALLERIHTGLPYNAELTLKEGKVYAHFTWSEELPVVSPDGNLRRHLTLSLEEVDSAPNKGAKELLLWKVAHQVVALAEEHGVAIATERLKYLSKSKRGDGSGRSFRRKQHRFAYRSLLEKIHSLARKRGVEVLEVNPQDTSTIGMLKYAPQLHLSKDVAAAYVIGRRALGFEEKLPKEYEALLNDGAFLAHIQGFYGSRLQELQKLREAEKNPYLKRALSREMGKARRALSLLLSFPGPQRGRKASLQGSSGSRKGVTKGRNPSGANPWRVLKAGAFLPLLGREVPRDLSPLKPVLLGSWERWKRGRDPHPGGGSAHSNVRFG